MTSWKQTSKLEKREEDDEQAPALSWKKQSQQVTSQLCRRDCPDHTCKGLQALHGTGFYVAVTAHKKICGLHQLASPEVGKPLLWKPDE